LPGETFSHADEHVFDRRTTIFACRVALAMILVIGGSGMIGRGVVSAAGRLGIPCESTTRKPGQGHFLDLSLIPDSWQIPKNVEAAVLCASVTGLKTCESDPEGTRAINVSATKILADRLAEQGTRVTFLSSNQVFGPDAFQPSEDDPPEPVTEYGRQKLAVERHLTEKIPSAKIIRLTKVVSSELPLFAKWAEDLGRGRPVRAYSNLHLSPLALFPTTAQILEIACSLHSGIFHLSASDSISYLDAAQWLASRLGVSSSLVQSDDAPHPNTPDSCRLGCERTHRLIGFVPQSAREAFG